MICVDGERPMQITDAWLASGDNPLDATGLERRLEAAGASSVRA